MVGIRGSNDSGKGAQMMEGAVELVGFYHDIRTFL